MSKRHQYGRISPAEAARMRANLPARYGPVLDLLTDRPQVRAAARYEDDGETDEFDHLFGPGPAAERHEAQRIAARAALSDEELYAGLFGPGAA